jgi:hypothetical protein
MKATARTLLGRLRKTRAGRDLRRRVEAPLNAVHGIEAFGRLRWLYRARGAIPKLPVHFRTPNAAGDADIALCQRLIEAYSLAQSAAPSASGVWGHELFQERQRELFEALDCRDPVLLANRLASMFRSEFVLGMAQGSFGLANQRRRWRRRFSCVQMLERLVSLAESLGSARAEDPEKAGVGIAFTEGVDKLVVDIEAALGASLAFPAVGAAYGLEIAGRLITTDSPDQIYGAARLRDAIQEYLSDRAGPLSVIEIGGGYGAMAYWLLQMMDVRYTIVDLPVVNVLQGYFLAQALGTEKVSFYGEPTGRVVVLPTHALDRIAVPFDVLANKDSMPEIPESALCAYLDWARGSCNGIFYSYNQEAAVCFDGTPQNVVHETVDRVGGFVRIRRDLSWLRAGYVEEIYRRVAGS